MAAVTDFVVEARDVNYVRQGQIDPTFLDLKYTEVFRSVGKWELKLPSNHPMLPTLKAKGSGIIVTRKGSPRPFSGRMKTCTLSQDAADPKGTWVISGVDDNVVAAATVVYPDPLNLASAQTADYWTRTSDAEDVMKVMVAYNGGPNSIASRKYPWLYTATNQHRGPTISASVRFDTLGEALTALGIRGNLGWRFYQVGANIAFDVFQPADKTALIRLDIRNGGLESTELGYTAPTATQALVLGQGEGAARTVRPVTSTASLAEAASWGLRWEVVKDERNTDDATELEQAGQEILTEQGTTVNSLKVVPADGPNQTLGIDWDLGDLITVVIDGTPAAATVTEVARSISSAGVITQATVGDPVGFDWEAQVSSAIKDVDSRVSFLEATVGTSVKDPKFDTVTADTTITAGTKLRVTSTGDLSPTSTAHGFQIGTDSGANLAMDNNEIMARQNGAAAPLYINADGGNIGLGDSASTVSIPGLVNTPGAPIRSAAGTVTTGGAIATGTSRNDTITFPAGRFTVPPQVWVQSTNGRITPAITATSTTSATLNSNNWSPASAPTGILLYWWAVQMTPTTATG